MDITSAREVEDFIRQNNIGIIINCAAYTNVDKAETEREAAMKINALGPEILAGAAKKSGATLIHISTDYVFDGTAHLPYTENNAINPTGVYGASKAAGEAAVIASGCRSVILRTSWLYSSYGNNFVKTMLRLGKEKQEIGVIFDQIGTPTYARDLADAILKIAGQLADTPRTGEIYHYSNEGVCSWYDFSTAVMKLSGAPCRVVPIETADYASATARPAYSVMNKRKIKADFGITIPHWQESLERCLEILIQ